ncbi:hypothetical protein [uncultured Psychrobacter sp.]|uniref:hypothetical protein n=1 Tax=uncultured Psychrobacter sp. TaxID=259303 RepID=UPI0030DBFBDC
MTNHEKAQIAVLDAKTDILRERMNKYRMYGIKLSVLVMVTIFVLFMAFIMGLTAKNISKQTNNDDSVLSMSPVSVDKGAYNAA